MNLKKWFDKRGPRFVIHRASALLTRYRISPTIAMARIEDSLAPLSRKGFSPTFFTPGIIVKRYPQFIQSLQAKGAEIAVHSYQHLDLNSMTLAKAKEQLDKAITTFNLLGINAHGFRCPYLSHSDELLESIDKGLFGYSSNKAVWIDVTQLNTAGEQSIIFNSLRRFYNPKLFTEYVSVPRSRANMIEIPVCVPDDLQLHDGLNLKSEGISQAWIEMLNQTHQRGELFNLIFHPELGSVCKDSFEDLLQKATLFRPFVWIARLQDICEWWCEKSRFGVEVSPTSTKLIINFACSPRATVVVRGIDNHIDADAWVAPYWRLNSRIFETPAAPRPFVGIAPGVPEHIGLFLQDQGYILDGSEQAMHCSVYIDGTVLGKLTTEVQLIEYIEKSAGPLVRYWRWPNGAKSALSITGDLDAITLIDYATRLSAH